MHSVHHSRPISTSPAIAPCPAKMLCAETIVNYSMVCRPHFHYRESSHLFRPPPNSWSDRTAKKKAKSKLQLRLILIQFVTHLLIERGHHCTILPNILAAETATAPETIAGRYFIDLPMVQEESQILRRPFQFVLVKVTIETVARLGWCAMRGCVVCILIPARAKVQCWTELFDANVHIVVIEQLPIAARFQEINFAGPWPTAVCPVLRQEPKSYEGRGDQKVIFLLNTDQDTDWSITQL